MDPLTLLPYALAAGGGRVGRLEVTSLVAAGVTLLQRSAPLVRALAGGRSAILLPKGAAADGPMRAQPLAAFLVALAASDGRGAVLCSPSATADGLGEVITRLRIGAVFTTAPAAHLVPEGVATVLLDEAPLRALVRVGDREQPVDLGTHYGLTLTGDTAAAGSPEECLCLTDGTVLTHGHLLQEARAGMATHKLTPVDRTLVVGSLETPERLVHGLFAPLLAGGIVYATAGDDPAALHADLTQHEATAVACDAVMLPTLPAGLKLIVT
jgi:hypothetical protein